MNAPRLLDLFCGAGGCTKGYQRAGFYVVGVDIVDQPRYCGNMFIRANALDVFDPAFWSLGSIQDFDAIHASPPCQGYSTMANRFPEKQAEYPMLISAVRDLLVKTELPYVIENVMGARADMVEPYRICGVSLNLGVQRHRLFETNFPLLVPPCACGAHKPIVGVYGERPDGRRLNSRSVKRIQYAASSLEEGQEAMGIDWMDWRSLTQAIPPAYTELIGHQLIDHLRASRRSLASAQTQVATRVGGRK